MYIIKAKNVNHALAHGLGYLVNEGIKETSRVGAVLVSPCPVVTVYANPTHRVIFHPARDANPFFHFMESLWMLAGRNDVEFVKYYASRMDQFSDNGKTLHGAYGYRWREAMGYDQLDELIRELRINPSSRRCVLQMWDATLEADETKHGGGCWSGSNDLQTATSGGKDVPCNTHAYFDTVGGKLNMTVCCRSNDVVWGAYGANVVHFSMLMEYVARSADLPIGEYRQFSNNYHLYVDRPDVERLIMQREQTQESGFVAWDYYSFSNSSQDKATPYPIMQNLHKGHFDAEMEKFFELWRPNHSNIMQPMHFKDGFWRDVVVPMHNVYQLYKLRSLQEAYKATGLIDATDWRIACAQWLHRRISRTGGSLA
jgi:thymidylate synthase